MSASTVAQAERFPRRAAGLAAALLLVAAGFKAYALAFGVTVAEAAVTNPSLQFALIQLELLLALWLLSGWRRPLALQVAAGVFTLFAATSLYLAWQGRASCGCFGTLSINPWLMFAIDTLAAGLLFLAARSAPAPSPARGGGLGWGPNPHEAKTPARLRPLALSLVGALALLTLGWFSLLALGEEPTAWLARLRGDLISVSPAEVDVGAGPAGQSVVATVTLRNNGPTPIRIIGGSSDCSCIATTDLPVTLAVAETKSIRVTLRRTGTPGVQRRKYLLYTDQPRQPRAHASLVGQVVFP